MKILKTVVGIFFIAVGFLFFLFLRALNDPEIEGESGRVGMGTYFLSLIPITIGMAILLFSAKNKSN